MSEPTNKPTNDDKKKQDSMEGGKKRPASILKLFAIVAVVYLLARGIGYMLGSTMY
jgi:hypothetical protein